MTGTEVVVTGSGLSAADRVALVLGGSCGAAVTVVGAAPSGSGAGAMLQDPALSPGTPGTVAFSSRLGVEARFRLEITKPQAGPYVAHGAAELGLGPKFSLCYDFGGTNEDFDSGSAALGEPCIRRPRTPFPQI